jgi:GMP synthase (glutamine-hydrolysing)
MAISTQTGMRKNGAQNTLQPKSQPSKWGVALGLPREMVYHHPFPDPGLSVRISGEVKNADLLRLADAIFIEK